MFTPRASERILMWLAGKCVVVTYGASGIDRATVQLLRDPEAFVVTVDGKLSA
jgi:NAD(P)-dependent dehydrogenase (short-subunit alcohol dehydrogenase family)